MNIDKSNNSLIIGNDNKIGKPENIFNDEMRDLSNNTIKDIKEENKGIKVEGWIKIKKEDKINKNDIDLKIENSDDKEKIPVEKNNQEKKHNTTCCHIH